MNIDTYLERLERLLEDYLRDAEELEKNRKPTELFGLKFGPADDRRHARFSEDAAALVRELAAAKPDSAGARAFLEALWNAPRRHPEPRSACWMLVAAQGLSQELIPLLSREDAAALAAAYERAWPRRARLPVQDGVLKALRRAAG